MSNFDSIKNLKKVGLKKESVTGTPIVPTPQAPIAPVQKGQILPYATVDCDQEAFDAIKLGSKLSLVFYGRTRTMYVYRKRKYKDGSYKLYVKPWLKN